MFKDISSSEMQVKFEYAHSDLRITSDRCNRIRLPKIEILKFDGEIKKWPTFFDLYKSLIHECSSLTNIERFQLLVSYLEKDTALVIKNIPIIDANS